MHHLTQRWEALSHVPQRRVAGGPTLCYPTLYGGKYHAANRVTGQALCRATVLVDMDADPIHIGPDFTERIHPIVCTRCVEIAKRRGTS